MLSRLGLVQLVVVIALNLVYACFQVWTRRYVRWSDRTWRDNPFEGRQGRLYRKADRIILFCVEGLVEWVDD